MIRARGGPDAGLSLVELIVAVAILSIATVGLFRVIDQASRATAGNRDRMLAALVARNRAEEIELGATGLSDAVTLAGRRWRVTTEAKATEGGFAEIVIRVVPDEGGAGATLVAYAPAGGS